MVTTKDKLEFVYAMAKHSTLTLHDCQRIMRYAATIQRLAETACNRELTPSELHKQLRMIDKLHKLCASGGIRPRGQGEPPGCVGKLMVPDGYTNDFGAE